MDIIHNINAVNIDTLSHQNKSLEKCILMVEKEKFCKYLDP